MIVQVKNSGFLGPGLLVAVGYMDPGNWITSMQGGAQCIPCCYS